MDNCLLSNTKLLPNWYLKILSFFPEFRTFNNFFNNSDYSIYNVIKPKYGLYSLKNINDIFKYHPNLDKQKLIILKYDSNSISMFEYLSNMFSVTKILEYDKKLDLDLNNIINNIITNEPKLILSQELLIGLFYALTIRKITYPFLEKKLHGLEKSKCLKYYRYLSGYNFIYNSLDNLIYSYQNKLKKKNKKNIYKINYDLPNNLLISNLIGGDKELIEFINGNIKSSKINIQYQTIILSILISKFCKLNNENKKPFSIQFVIDTFINNLDSDLKNDMSMMIKIFQLHNILYKNENNIYFITPNYEDKIYNIFINSSYWWSFEIKSINYIKISENIDEIVKLIFEIFSPLMIKFNKKSYIPIACYSGCDNTFVEQCGNLNNSLLFIETLPLLFSSYKYETVFSLCKNNNLFYNNIELNKDIHIKLSKNKLVDLDNYHNHILTPIFSNITIINNYNKKSLQTSKYDTTYKKNNDNIYINYNTEKIKLNVLKSFNIYLSQYLLLIKDSKSNNNVIYTDDPNLKLLAHLYGCNLIYERLSNGNRYLEIYKSTKSVYSL